MTLQVPSTVRCTIHGEYYGAPVANILDMFVAEDLLPEADRAEACEIVAGNVLFTWNSRILPVLNANYIANSVSYVDLSEVNGAVGNVVTRGAVTWPKPGTVAGEGYSQNVATLITKNTVARRGERPGRMFLVPPGESLVAASLIAPAHVTTLNTAFANFLTDVTTSGDTADSSFPVVVHQQSAIVGTPTRITSMTARPRVSSQRRRNR